MPRRPARRGRRAPSPTPTPKPAAQDRPVNEWTPEQVRDFLRRNERLVALLTAMPVVEVLERDWRREVDAAAARFYQPLSPRETRRLLDRSFLVSVPSLTCAYCGAATHAAGAQPDPAPDAPERMLLLPVCRTHAALWSMIAAGPEYTERYPRRHG